MLLELVLLLMEEYPGEVNLGKKGELNCAYLNFFIIDTKKKTDEVYRK